jgi:hypothetical protein
MSKKIFIFILAIAISIAFLNVFTVADEFDEEGVVHAAKRGAVVKTQSEGEAIKAAKAKLKTSKLLRTEINFLSFDEEQDKLVHLGDSGKVRRGQKYVIQIVNNSYDDIHLYAFQVVGKKVTRLFPNEDESIVYGGADAIISGDEPAKFNKFSKGKVVLYFFLSKKRMKNLEKKISSKNLEKAYKSYAKKVKQYAAKLKETKELDQFDGKEFNPYNVWFKGKLAKKVVISRRK